MSSTGSEPDPQLGAESDASNEPADPDFMEPMEEDPAAFVDNGMLILVVI